MVYLVIYDTSFRTFKYWLCGNWGASSITFSPVPDRGYSVSPLTRWVYSSSVLCTGTSNSEILLLSGFAGWSDWEPSVLPCKWKAVSSVPPEASGWLNVSGSPDSKGLDSSKFPLLLMGSMGSLSHVSRFVVCAPIPETVPVSVKPTPPLLYFYLVSV